MLTRIDHVGIACRSLAEKIAFYETVFGLRLVSEEVNEQQGVREAIRSCLSRSGRTPRSANFSPGAARESTMSATA